MMAGWRLTLTVLVAAAVLALQHGTVSARLLADNAASTSSAAALTSLRFVEGLSIFADDDDGALGRHKNHKKKDKVLFKSPVGVFIQERASKQLPGPGQHFSFGALQSWETIHQLLDVLPNSKLLLLIRHGQAVSNWLSDYLGPDVWFDVESKCTYSENGTTYGVFDAELTDLGRDQAASLNGMLADSGWFAKLTAGRPTHAVVSPLSRCLQTASVVLDRLNFTAIEVEENVRETLGEDTCDARRAASDPDPDDPDRLTGPCRFKDGLRTTFPDYKFPIVGYGADGKRVLVTGADGSPASDPEVPASFGLLSDRDLLWTKDREAQDDQVKRSTRFLTDVFAYAPEKVVTVLTHSGFVRSLLLAVGREPYRPQNTELVPMIVQRVLPTPELEDE